MSDISHSDELVTKQELASFYQGILPYLGGMPEAIANKFSKSDIYSTSERIIGCWTDGKPLYQKVIPFTSPSVATSPVTLTTFSVNVDVKAIYGYLISSAQHVPFPWGMGENYFYAWQNTATVINMNMGPGAINGGYGGKNGYAIIQYTKTTDSAVNVGYESDYSTTEKIIGTWIDGKPLYQKTINFGSPTGTTTTKAHGISNINTIINTNGFWIQNTNPKVFGPIGESNNDGSTVCFIWVDPSNISIESRGGFNASNITYFITLQYTKTTD